MEYLGPGLSGVIGGTIATWLVAYWSRRLPNTYRSKSRSSLLKQHRTAIWIANVLFFLGLLLAIALYPLGGYANTDARPLLLGWGLGSILPLIAIFIVSVMSGRDPKEAYVAYSWGQGAPIWATYGILGAGVVAFIFGVASLGA